MPRANLVLRQPRCSQVHMLFYFLECCMRHMPIISADGVLASQYHPHTRTLYAQARAHTQAIRIHLHHACTQALTNHQNTHARNIRLSPRTQGSIMSLLPLLFMKLTTATATTAIVNVHVSNYTHDLNPLFLGCRTYPKFPSDNQVSGLWHHSANCIHP